MGVNALYNGYQWVKSYNLTCHFLQSSRVASPVDVLSVLVLRSVLKLRILCQLIGPLLRVFADVAIHLDVGGAMHGPVLVVGLEGVSFEL